MYIQHNTIFKGYRQTLKLSNMPNYFFYIGIINLLLKDIKEIIRGGI